MASTSTSTSQFKINSVSPLFKYTPSFPSGDGSLGWSLGSNSWIVGLAPGERYSFTKTPATSTFSFSFYGKSIQLYGNSTCSSTLSIDGSKSADSQHTLGPVPAIILQASNLNVSQHSVDVLVQCSTSGEFSFAYALLDGWLDPVGVIPEIRNVDDQDPSITWGGNWTSRTALPISNHYADSQHYTWDVGGTMAFTFTEPAIAIMGSRHPNHGPYSVQVSDGPVTSVQTYNASSPTIMSPEVIFFEAGMKSGSPKTITITNLGPNSSLDIDYISLFSSSNQFTTSTVNVHTGSRINITGLVWGIMGAVLAVAMAFFVGVFYGRKRERRRERDEMTRRPFNPVMVQSPGSPREPWSPYNPLAELRVPLMKSPGPSKGTDSHSSLTGSGSNASTRSPEIRNP